jgi:hypothetical protein
MMDADASAGGSSQAENDEADSAELRSPGKIAGGLRDVYRGLKDAPFEVYTWARYNRYQTLMLGVGSAALLLEISSRISMGPVKVAPIVKSLTPNITNGQLFLALIGTVVVEIYILKGQIEELEAIKKNGES